MNEVQFQNRKPIKNGVRGKKSRFSLSGAMLPLVRMNRKDQSSFCGKKIDDNVPEMARDDYIEFLSAFLAVADCCDQR